MKRMKRMKRRLATLLLVITLLAPLPALAIFGIGDIVFDPTNYAEAIRQLIQMEQQYEQLVETYQTVRRQYDHMIEMAKQAPVDMRRRYRSPVTGWGVPSATNTYGTTSAWLSAITTGAGASAGYQAASEPLLSYGTALANVPADQLDRLTKQYGTVEITDGANVHAIDTIGRMRRNAPLNEAVLQALEDDSLSSNPAMNTEIALLNKINAAAVINLRTAQDTNKVLVSVAEQQVIEAKRRRDAEARAINHHVRFMAEEQRLLETRGITDAMLAWRMP